MGARTSTRKRNDDLITLTTRNPHYNSSPDYLSSKRLRLMSMNQGKDGSLTSKTTFSRVWRYPDLTLSRPREVHAPVKSQRFGPSTSLNRDLCQVSSATVGVEIFDKEEDLAKGVTDSKMAKYIKTMREALSSLRFRDKFKQVIDWAKKDKGQNEVNSEDSSIEEIHALPSATDKLKPAKVSTANTQESVVSQLSNGNAMRVEGAGKMLSSLSVESGDDDVEVLNESAFQKMLNETNKQDTDDVEVLNESAYKKMLHEASKRDTGLARISSDIRLYEEKWSSLQKMRPTKKAEEIPREPFVALTDEEKMEVECALSGNPGKVLVVHEKSSIEITGRSLQCLRPGAWLNDEVINLYLELLKEREKGEPKKFLTCHFFNTFFYKKLIGGKGGYDYKSVRRWTTQRKLGYSLMDCDKIFVPIHQEVHWCLAIINKKDKKFQYLDSLGGKDRNVLKILGRYIVDEVKDKNGEDIDVGSWPQEYVQDLPKQENSYDCGMFMIKYTDFYSRGLGLCFKQEHMPYFRWRTAKEILKLRAD